MNFIKDFKDGEPVIDHYLCKQKNMLKSRAGKNYLSIKLQDKTGTIEGKVWELGNEIHNFDENDFIKIDASVLNYQNELQLNIKRIRKSREGEYDPKDYIPTTEKDTKQMYNGLVSYIKTLENRYIKQLLENVLVKSKTITDLFTQHSAAKNMHHSYMGGLLEHTLSVVEICDFMSGRYQSVNRDILLCSAILHDIGKIYEISPFPINDYTDDGQLLGHIYIGTELVEKEAALIEGFPPKLLSLIKHSILAHHGEYEYGSPKRPKTIEAFILHAADNMDAKVKAFEEAIASESGVNGSWVGYHKLLSRNIRRSDF